MFFFNCGINLQLALFHLIIICNEFNALIIICNEVAAKFVPSII